MNRRSPSPANTTPNDWLADIQSGRSLWRETRKRASFDSERLLLFAVIYSRCVEFNDFFHRKCLVGFELDRSWYQTHRLYLLNRQFQMIMKQKIFVNLEKSPKWRKSCSKKRSLESVNHCLFSKIQTKMYKTLQKLKNLRLRLSRLLINLIVWVKAKRMQLYRAKSLLFAIFSHFVVSRIRVQ